MRTRPGTIDQLLAELEELLTRNRYQTQADFISKLRDLDDPNDFTEQVQSLDFWGGAGSVIGCAFVDLVEHRRSVELVVELNEALEQIGLASPRSRQVSLTFEDWLISNPSE